MKRLSIVFVAATGLLFALALPALAQTYFLEGLLIEKEVVGEDAPLEEDGVTWDFAMSCVADEEDVDFDGDGTTILAFTLGDGDQEFVDAIPVDAECTITEVGPSDPELEDDYAVVVTVGEETFLLGEDRTAAIGPFGEEAVGGVVTVTFTNDFGETPVLPTADLELTKDAVGQPPSDDPYGFEIDCTDQDVLAVQLAAGESVSVPVVLDPEAGATCTITETENLGADETRFFLDGDEIGEGVAVVELDPPEDEDQEPGVLALRAENTFDPEPTPTPVDEVEVAEEVLVRTGFDLTWGMLLALGLLLPGGAALYLARRRDSGGWA